MLEYSSLLSTEYGTTILLIQSNHTQEIENLSIQLMALFCHVGQAFGDHFSLCFCSPHSRWLLRSACLISNDTFNVSSSGVKIRLASFSLRFLASTDTAE
jgi:hypothetical protein